MAQKLGQVSEGTIVKINENGSPVDFYVAKQNYESGLNGAGRTLVVRKDCYDNRAWDNGNVNAYSGSDLDTWFNGTYKNLLDPAIQTAIGTTKFYYTPGNGNWTVGTLERAVFALSLTELGQSHTYANTEGSALPIASTLRIAYRNGSATTQWTRSPRTHTTGDAVFLNFDGSVGYNFCNYSFGSRPAFTLPSYLYVSDDGTIGYPIPTLTVPQMVMQGQQATISWSAIEGADSYTLQRKANTDADWTQVYSGANLSYSETVGTWTSVQYRVQAVFDGTPGGWATSDPIQIVSASALVISGQDGDLGTLVNDVPYSISSDQTSPTIDVTVEVNGGEYASFQATSGQTYKVGVLDLPTGTGSIVITATTTVSESPVTVTRTWTYNKTAQTFPNSGSVATLTKEGNVVYPETLVEAVRAAMTPWGGNLSTALELLKRAALFNRTKQAKYSEVTVSMANVTEGQIISIPRGGVMTPHYVGKLEYESGLNGAGRRLMVPVECYNKRQWNTTDVATYATSAIDIWMNGEYKALFPEEIQTAMGTTKFYYTQNAVSDVTTLERSVFALSANELGKSAVWFNAEGSVLPIASALQIAKYNGSAIEQWTRTPTNNALNAVCLLSNGNANGNYCTDALGSRPCFTLPSTYTYGPVYVDQDGNIHDQQEYTEAGDWLDVWGNAIPAVKIETGSYVGTGTYGNSNPTIITASFTPKIVFIMADSGVNTYPADWFIRGTLQINILSRTSGNAVLSLAWDEFSVKLIAASNAEPQFNKSGVTYRYIIIG